MSAGAIRAGQAFIELTTRDSELQKGLKNAQAKLRAFGASVTQIGRDLLMLSGAVAAPLALATRTFANFDDQMRMVRAVTGATGKDFDLLTEKAKKLGRETSFTASQVASGMLSLGRMGFSPQEIDAAIAGVMNLAKATGTDLGSAAEIAGNNLRVFNMDASKMGEVVDLMTVTANGSAQTLEDLGESLKMAGPLAQRAGADLKDTCAALGILANMGIRGSLAGTALGKSYKRLADPKVIAYLRQFNISTVDNAGTLRRMRDILVDIARVMKDMPSAERINFAENVFDARGSLGGGTLALNTEAIDQFIQKLDAARGAASRTAQEMEAGIGGSIRRLLSALEGVGLVIGEIISKSLVPMAETLSRVLLNMRDWIAQNNGLISVLAKLVAGGLALGAALMVVGAAAKGVAAVMAIASVGLQVFGSAVKAIIAMRGVFIATMASWSAAVTAFNAAGVAGIGICGALRAAIFALMASNPVGWVLAIIGAVAGLIALIATLGTQTVKTADKMESLLNQNDRLRQLDQQKMKKLQQLSQQQRRTSKEMEEAATLVQELEDKYGPLNIKVNQTAKSIGNLAKAQNTLNQAMSKSTIIDIDKQISEYQENIRKVAGYNENFWTGWKGVGSKMLNSVNLWWDYWTIDGSESKAQKAIKANERYIREQQAKIAALEKRKESIASGEINAVNGKTDVQGNVIPAVSYEKYFEAAEAAKKIEDKFVSERRTDLANEMVEIDQLNKKYKELIATMWAFEMGKPATQRDPEKIAALQQKYLEADQVAAERKQRAQAKANKSALQNLKQQTRSFVELWNRTRQRRQQKETDWQIERQIERDPDAAIRTINDAIRQFSAASAQAAAEFNRVLTDAARPDADGGVRITDDEQQRIDAARAKYEASEAQIDSYRDKLRSAEDQLAQMSRRGAGPIGSYSAREVANRVAGAGTAEERTAKAAEQTVEQLKKTNELLRNKSVTFA